MKIPGAGHSNSTILRQAGHQQVLAEGTGTVTMGYGNRVERENIMVEI